ncbi:MAG: hypothetical protein ACETWE_02855, partial [Candidatus Bathyarchaeia archaeon]
MGRIIDVPKLALQSKNFICLALHRSLGPISWRWQRPTSLSVTEWLLFKKLIYILFDLPYRLKH